MMITVLMNRFFLTVVLTFVLIFSVTVCFSKATERSDRALSNNNAVAYHRLPCSEAPANGSEMERAVMAHLS